MPGFTPFTSNYQDLSTNQGYQFEFRCDICGSGYRSEYQKNLLGTGASILGGASNLIGGLWGARNVADSAQQIELETFLGAVKPEGAGGNAARRGLEAEVHGHQVG